MLTLLRFAFVESKQGNKGLKDFHMTEEMNKTAFSSKKSCRFSTLHAVMDLLSWTLVVDVKICKTLGELFAYWKPKGFIITSFISHAMVIDWLQDKTIQQSTGVFVSVKPQKVKDLSSWLLLQGLLKYYKI